MSRGSSLGTAEGYRLDGKGSVPGMARDFSLQTGSGAHPAWYPIFTGVLFPRKWSGRVVNPITHLHSLSRSRMVELYVHLYISSWHSAQLSGETHSLIYHTHFDLSSGLFPYIKKRPCTKVIIAHKPLLQYWNRHCHQFNFRCPL
jgi:hypothetical protein